jgi:hypothetical protein
VAGLAAWAATRVKAKINCAERHSNQMPIDIVYPTGCATGARPEGNVIVMRTLFAASCLAGLVIAGAAVAPAYAGPPGKTCQNTKTASGQLTTPGNAGAAPGSVFNEPGFGSPTGGTGGNAYNNIARQGAGAPSQYDVACFNNQSGGLSPPTPASTAPTASAPASTAPTATGPTTAKTGHTPHH